MECQTRPRGLIGGVLPAGPFPSDHRKAANPCGAKRQRYRDEMEEIPHRAFIGGTTGYVAQPAIASSAGRSSRSRVFDPGRRRAAVQFACARYAAASVDTAR